MKWIYLAAGAILFIKMLVFPSATIDPSAELSIVETVVKESGVPNAVSGIIFRNRLYDTIFEVVVFTIAIMGALTALTSFRFIAPNARPSMITGQSAGRLAS